MNNQLSYICNDYNSIQFLGKNQQGLQILLKPNESIILNKDSVSYYSNKFSENLHYKKQAIEELLENSTVYNKFNKSKEMYLNPKTTLNKFGKSFDFKSNNFIKFTNENKELQYIGVSSIGKIMTINTRLYYKLFINSNYIIAFDSDISLYTYPIYNKKLCKEFDYYPSYNYFKSFVVGYSCEGNDRSKINYNCIETIHNTISNNSNLTISNNISTDNKYIYIQSESKLI